MIKDQANLKCIVELTETGPVLNQSTIKVTSVGSIESYEVTADQWKQLQELMQTGQLDNAKVIEVIGKQ